MVSLLQMEIGCRKFGGYFHALWIQAAILIPALPEVMSLMVDGLSPWAGMPAVVLSFLSPSNGQRTNESLGFFIIDEGSGGLLLKYSILKQLEAPQPFSPQGLR